MRITLDVGAKSPTKAHPDDAGYDLYALGDYDIPAHGFGKIETGVHFEIPKGHFGLVTSKSGLMGKGLTCRGTIDSNYRGSVKAVIFNHSNVPYHFDSGDKVTQIVIMPYDSETIEVVASLEDTDRGDGGFGSTGK